MNDANADRPTIRILHHLARSGGTVISKCLATMQGVYLLSEIHPRSQKAFRNSDAIVQARQWFGLIDAEDMAWFKARSPIPFVDVIARINQKAEARGGRLLLRDWTHYDFTGHPFNENPSYRLRTAEVLAEKFRVVHTATVRHPIDQWLSLRRLAINDERLTIERYLEGYLRFAEKSREVGFLRYEDFTRDPDAALALLCERLETPFDPGYRERWYRYTKITGDKEGTREKREIRPLKRRAVEAGLVEAFERDPNYHEALALLGYRHE